MQIIKMKLEASNEERYAGKMNGNGLHRVFNYGSGNMNIIEDICAPIDFNVTNNISRVDCSRDFNVEETKPLELLNLDAQNDRRDYILNSHCDHQLSFSEPISYGGKEKEIDVNSWEKKPTDEWERSDTTRWLIRAYAQLGDILYPRMSRTLSMPGRDLLRLTRQQFISHDERCGSSLYDFLHNRQETENFLPSFDSFHQFSDDEISRVSGNNCSASDGEFASRPGCIKRSPGRPRSLDTKVKLVKPKLWEFVRNLLLDPKYCPQIICWENYDKKRFRFVKSENVAKLWGDRKKNKNMTYEKFSRAMRYYYKKRILEAVHGRRLVYGFGTAATGLETDDPNFLKAGAARSKC